MLIHSTEFLRALRGSTISPRPEPVEGHARAISHRNACNFYFISTKPMRFTPLHARAMLPSRVTSTLRTTPPPDGIFQV